MRNIVSALFNDPTNAKILAVSEDRLQGFQHDPLGEISRQSGVELPVATNASATISAVYAGTTQTATLTVTAATLTSVSLNPTSVRGGTR